MQQKQIGAVVAKAAGLGPRQIRVIASTENADRVGDVLLMSGCDLKSYRKNPIVLADHDRCAPIGTAVAEVKGARLEAVITFAPPGASEKADEYCALAKSGVISAASVGFMPIAQEPIKGGGYKIKAWELYEISLVAIPANADAVVMQRSLSPRPSVFGRTVSAKSTERDRRRRIVDALGLKNAPAETLTAADRKADLARLKAKAITPPSADLAGPAFAHAKAANLAADNLARSAAAYSNAPASEAQRLGDLARLGR